MYLAIAASDDDKQPDAKDKLKAAFAAAHVQGRSGGLYRHGPWLDRARHAGRRPRQADLQQAGSRTRLDQPAQALQDQHRLIFSVPAAKNPPGRPFPQDFLMLSLSKHEEVRHTGLWGLFLPFLWGAGRL